MGPKRTDCCNAPPRESRSREPLRLRGVLLCALLALPVVGQEQRLAFEPTPSLRRQKRIERSEELTLDEFELTVDGNDLATALRTLDFEVTNRLSLRLFDDYQSGDSAGPNALERTFESLELQTTQVLFGRHRPAGEEASLTCSSPFEKRSLSLSRDGEGKVVARPPATQEAPDPLQDEPLGALLLSGLTIDLDATAFLPQVPVQRGERWRVDPARVGPLFSPAGELHFRPSEETLGAARTQGTTMGSRADDRFKGEIWAQFEGVSETAGGRRGRLRLEVVLASERQLTNEADGLLPSFPAPARFRASRYELRTSFEGGGTLVWDLEANVLESLELRGTCGVTVELEGELGAGAVQQALAMRLGLAGPQTLSLRCGS